MPDDASLNTIHTIAYDPAATGEPGKRMTTKLWYSDPDGAFRSGFWSSEPGKSDINYVKDELCTLLEGTVRLTAADGTVATYTAGDTFLIPKGFKGTWETLVAVRKFFATYQKP